MMVRSFVLFAVLATIRTVVAQDKCGFGGDDNLKKTQQLLRDAKTCTASAKLLQECAWGSSADNIFAGIVIPKCEETFRRSLNPAEEARYAQEMRSCGLRYEKQQGTMSISAAALCAVDVAASYSSDAGRRKESLLRASFNCDRASSPLEQAICSDQDLGDADLVLSRVYLQTMTAKSFLLADSLKHSERDWLRRLPTLCPSQTKAGILNTKCLHDQFTARIALVDVCSDVEANETSKTASDYLACLNDSSLLNQ